MPIEGAAFADAFTLAWAAIASAVSKQVQMAAPGVPLDAVLEPLTIGLAERFNTAPEGAFEGAVALLREAEARYAAMFNDIDVLLTPVLGSTPPAIGEIGPASGMEGSSRSNAMSATRHCKTRPAHRP